LIKINLPTQIDPQSGATAAVIAGIATGSVVVIVVIVVIRVYLKRNGEDESETGDDVSDLR
jgi:hypothetical protein